MPSDKSKRLVALKHEQYDKLMETQTEQFKKYKYAQPNSVANYFNAKLSKIGKKYPQLHLHDFCCSDPVPSKLRLLPKDHKDGELTGRPIVASTDSPATKLSRYLAQILNGLIKEKVPAHLSSTEDFTNIIKDFKMNEDMKFASLDVVNLYGSIPVNDHTFPGVLTIVTNFFEIHKIHTSLNCLSAVDFRDLLNLSLTSDTIQANDTTYKQKRGLQMGNSVSGPCAIIFMNFIEEQIFSSTPQIILWKRFLDDCFVIYKDMTSDELVHKCNDFHSDISFTCETPVNNILPFLDLDIKLKANKFSFTLHSKPCHSGNVIHWSSHHPRSVLINVLKNEIRRAIRNSSDI